MAVSTVRAEYQAGLDAYEAGDFATALAEWREEVNRPAPPASLAIYREALYAIGMLYWNGEGVAQDYAVSAVWLKQAADINHPGAQVKLGYLYSTGQGVPQNFHEARRWLQLAAVQGDRDAAYNLDILDREGLGWPDSTRAAGPNPVTAPTTGHGIEPGADRVAETAAGGPDAPSVNSGADPAPGAATAADTEWIRARDPDHYTIQVIALRNPEPLHEFTAGHPEWAPFAIYTPSGNALPLWVLVQGDYPDADAAQAAAAQFPNGLQSQDQLWIRRFSKIQDLLE